MNRCQAIFSLTSPLILISMLVLLAIGCSPPQTTQTIPTQTPSPVQPGVLYITSKEAWQHIDEYKVVEYYVANPFRSSKGNIFLNERADFKNGFTATIFSSSAALSGDPIAKYGYKTIRVRGTIKMYEGHPEIIVSNPLDITVVR